MKTRDVDTMKTRDFHPRQVFAFDEPVDGYVASISYAYAAWMAAVRQESPARQTYDLVELRNSPFAPVAIQLSVGSDTIDVLLSYSAPDRDTGARTMVMRRGTIHAGYAHDPGVLTDFIISELRACYMHEFDEALHVNGVRVRDPHAKEKVVLK